EMLYWLVGSRDLDGGLMCTASHNPKAYTGAKLVKQGAIALSGDSGIGELRELVLGDRLDGGAAHRGTVEEVDVYDAFHEAALRGRRLPHGDSRRAPPGQAAAVADPL